MAKSLTLSDADYVIIGRRYGSTAVADEAGEAAERWARDVAALAEYGHGEAALTAFRADIAAHAALRQGRPTAVAQKTVSIGARDDAVTAAWRWVGTVTSLLGSLARKDAELGAQLAAATPDEDSELAVSVRALEKLVEANAARLPSDSHASDRIAEAEPIAATLEASAPAVATAKAAPVQDTEELDLADGKLYIAIKDLNAAARKAIRAGKLSARVSEYRMKHLKRTRAKPAKPNPA